MEEKSPSRNATCKAGKQQQQQKGLKAHLIKKDFKL